MDWIKQYISKENNLSRIDWETVDHHADRTFSDVDQHKLWNNIAMYWVNTLTTDLPSGYWIKETKNFILLSKESERYATSFSNFLERCLKRLKHTLKGIANDEGYGKHVVMIFHDIDTYYDYTSYYFADGGTYSLRPLQ